MAPGEPGSPDREGVKPGTYWEVPGVVVEGDVFPVGMAPEGCTAGAATEGTDVLPVAVG